jgi:uncharacterized membrane protein
MTQIHYLPLTPGFFAILVGIFIIVLILRSVRYAYESLGVSSGAAMFLLFATLVGSIFNIPVAELPPERIVSHEVIHFFGMRYRVPVVTHWAGTVIAVNVGGAVIPTLMSVYLLIKRQLWVKGLIATAVVALVIHWMADPVPGLGIAVPVFMPALVTAAVALLLSRKDAPPLAYIAGGLGTLIGRFTQIDGPRQFPATVSTRGRETLAALLRDADVFEKAVCGDGGRSIALYCFSGVVMTAAGYCLVGT